MIRLYACRSPNVLKVYIALEEAGLDYSVVEVDVFRGEQFEPWFGKLNPGRKLPVIVDEDRLGGEVTVFESGAILLFLADRAPLLRSKDPAQRLQEIQWLMVQMSAIGPAFGQFAHFSRHAGDQGYAIGRFTTQVRRLYDLLEARLCESDFVAGAEYSIADISIFPWLRTLDGLFAESHPVAGMSWNGHPRLNRWFAAIAERPAVRRAIDAHDRCGAQRASASPEQLARYYGQAGFRLSLVQ